MKFTTSGVAICAGITRSPSFSRSSWSTRMKTRTGPRIIDDFLDRGDRVVPGLFHDRPDFSKLMALLGHAWRPAAR
jgi:hypothetical protein